MSKNKIPESYRQTPLEHNKSMRDMSKKSRISMSYYSEAVAEASEIIKGHEAECIAWLMLANVIRKEDIEQGISHILEAKRMIKIRKSDPNSGISRCPICLYQKLDMSNFPKELKCSECGYIFDKNGENFVSDINESEEDKK